MIVDILFNDSEPKQYQNVRKTMFSGNFQVVIIYFHDDIYPEMAIRTDRIKSLQTTND